MISKSASSWNLAARLSVVALMFGIAGALVWATQSDLQSSPDPVAEQGNACPSDCACCFPPSPEERPPVIARKPITERESEVLFKSESTALEPVKFVKHTPPNVMRDRLLKRLHHEALTHFYSDPRNGFSRMPVVYEHLKREWKVPEFATGDLGTVKEIPFEDDLKRIHNGSVKDFNDPKGETNSKAKPIARVINFKNFDSKKFDATKVWEAKNVDLIGLMKHRDPVAYVSEKIPAMKDLGKTPTRQLDDFESSGLSTLYSGKELYARSHEGTIRLLGAVRARKDCLSCHTTKKEGDLLGAFSYTIREAKYERRVKRPNFGPRKEELDKLRKALSKKSAR